MEIKNRNRYDNIKKLKKKIKFQSNSAIFLVKLYAKLGHEHA